MKKKWSETEAGHKAYLKTRAEAQALADSDGYDRGIEANELFHSWRIFMLPQKQNRYGFELRCEVVSCMNLAKCKPGHGPK